MEDKIEVSKPDQDSDTSVVESNESSQKEETLVFAEVKKLIDDHFNSIKALIRYTKEKDANVLALSKQMQVYRDGLETVLLKRVALEIIEYRENCRKSLRIAEKSELNAQEAKKYVNYLKLDFEDMLENLGIKCTDTAVLYNGKNIDVSLEKPSFRDVPQLEDVGLDNPEIVDINGLIEYLKVCEDSLSKIIQNNTILDSVVRDYISISAIYEQGLYQIVLYPVVRTIAKIYRTLSERVEELEITDSNATEAYSAQLSLLIEEVEKVLELCNVQIDSYVSDTYDSKKQRILKMIDTEDPDLNGHVICRYTDCYTMEDKVIYLSKVDVYKSKQN